ncbi:MAG: serine/threonine protein kinase [Cyanobacteria bacterium SBLK]|nr:serine/threonine protein kinase [Cyanobacteria bacterium SBLK]
MTLPDLTSHGYQIERELGCNHLGGRVTYLAQNQTTQQAVVIKQFQFARLDSNWDAYREFEQEIHTLQRLSHAGIPRYLDTFETSDGLCLVQEFIQAQSLSSDSTWTPQKIKNVALRALAILVYLQKQSPVVIHRDIKPENILLDAQGKVYLVDFGFARMGGGEVAASSVVKGTMGFMPPEQLFNRELTTASDLYGLGVTLICLLTGIKSGEIGNLIDADYRLHFRHLVPPQEIGWLNWLEKMVEANPKDRYRNAKEAILALKPLNVTRLPKLRLSHAGIEFSDCKYGKILTQNLMISNPIPETMLAGRWEVVPHISDSPHTPYRHSWIHFQPHKFEGNEVECEVRVDTRFLSADRTYIRKILLHHNAAREPQELTLQVTTQKLPDFLIRSSQGSRLLKYTIASFLHFTIFLILSLGLIIAPILFGCAIFFWILAGPLLIGALRIDDFIGTKWIGSVLNLNWLKYSRKKSYRIES